MRILLDRGLGAVGVAIDPVPPKGILRLPWSTVRASSPVLFNPANVRRTVMLTLAQSRYVFANTMSEKEARVAYERYAVPGPGRPVFQAAFANLNPWAPATKINYANADRAPLLLIRCAPPRTRVPLACAARWQKGGARVRLLRHAPAGLAPGALALAAHAPAHGQAARPGPGADRPQGAGQTARPRAGRTLRPL